MTPREAAEQVVALFDRLHAEGVDVHWHWDEQLTVARGADYELLLVDGNTTVGSEWGWRSEGDD